MKTVQLSNHIFEHIFNNTDFNTYRAKVVNGQTDVNNYSAALNILDMFILNSPVC